jgi:transcriptional regulator with XRE-family HTH domain
MSQTTLARELGIAAQQIQKYETGKNRIVASRLYDIAAVLDVSISVLMTTDPIIPAQQPALQEDNLVQFIASTEGRGLNDAFRKIACDRTRRLIVALADAIAKQNQ